MDGLGPDQPGRDAAGAGRCRRGGGVGRSRSAHRRERLRPEHGVLGSTLNLLGARAARVECACTCRAGAGARVGDTDRAGTGGRPRSGGSDRRAALAHARTARRALRRVAAPGLSRGFHLPAFRGCVIRKDDAGLHTRFKESTTFNRSAKVERSGEMDHENAYPRTDPSDASTSCRYRRRSMVLMGTGVPAQAQFFTSSGANEVSQRTSSHLSRSDPADAGFHRQHK